MNRRAVALMLAVVLAATSWQLAGCGSRLAPSGTGRASAGASASTAATSSAPAGTQLTFAVIGDYGTADSHESAVASLVASWKPAFVIATGDDYYSGAGGSGTGRYDQSTGAYYGRWLKDIHTTGHRLPMGLARVNAFFPAMGNHDYSDALPSPGTYLTYFTLPGAGFANTSGSERYYDYVEGPVHFFVLDSNQQEPAGTSATSKQAQWLKTQLAASTSPWNIVYDHHPPYSSDSTHGSTSWMQWPFAAWGADVVISGHAHVYERVMRNGIVYFVNGLGGAGRHAFGSKVQGSAVRFDQDWGAQRASVTSTTLDFEFRTVSGAFIDSWHLIARKRAAN
jgi:tartrate-resistant acid phosphatase type 5